MATIKVMLNLLGMPVQMEYIDRLTDGNDHSDDLEYRMIRQVIDLPHEHVPRDVLERYIEVTNQDSHATIFPHTDKLFDRFLVPFKSSKKMYCLGEYLACIDLSAHLGEMLALLVWQITPVTLNGRYFDTKNEKVIFGN